MDMAVEDIANGATRVVWRGRIDTTRAVLIELPFNTLAAQKKAIVVDLSAVDFLSSYGLRVLLMGAKISKGKGGRLVVVCPGHNIAKVLRTSGASHLIQVFQSEADALAAITSPP
jgi:anti-anti-sigma factor